MKDKRTLFFDKMQVLEFSVYYLKDWNMKVVEQLYYNMVAMLMGAFANDEITEHEFLIFDDYLGDVHIELFGN